jgi:hypothetical protein
MANNEAMIYPAAKSRKKTCPARVPTCSCTGAVLPFRSLAKADDTAHTTSRMKNSGKMYFMKMSII